MPKIDNMLVSRAINTKDLINKVVKIKIGEDSGKGGKGK